MRSTRYSIVALLVFTLALAPSAFAQERHAVAPSQLSQTLSQVVSQQDADRASIRQALERPEVRDVAARSGLDLDRIEASINTLSGSSLTQVASAANQVNQTLVGGASTIIISTTTIIVALLLVILLVVAVD